jgi:uncharacterized protein YndB with AHSA1/START domain
VPRVVASRELLAPREEVWKFLAEPHHLPDWWPGVRGVRPDRRGLAPGARWQLSSGPQAGGLIASFVRSPDAAGTVVVLDVRTNELVRLLFADDRIEAEIQLEAAPESHTRVTLAVEGPWLRINRSLPRRALNRLYALCQTAADL